MKMLNNVLENLFSKYSTRMYPAEVRTPFKDFRGELYNDIDDCIFCGMCARKCPSQCIAVDKKEATWVCDAFACVYCGICVEACPVQCLHQKETYRPVSRERVMMNLKGEVKAPAKKGTPAKAADASAAKAELAEPKDIAGATERVVPAPKAEPEPAKVEAKAAPAAKPAAKPTKKTAKKKKK